MFRWNSTGTRFFLIAHCAVAQHARQSRTKSYDTFADDDDDETSSIWGPIGAGIAFALLFIGVVIVRCNKEGPRKGDPPPPEPKPHGLAHVPPTPPLPLYVKSENKYLADRDVEIGEAATPEAVTYDSSR
jgi:hypothetical protein